MKKTLFFVLLCVLSLTCQGCSDQKARELFDLAQFEELQNNQDHARKLYGEIISQYPDSEYADKAAERLFELVDRPPDSASPD